MLLKWIFRAAVLFIAGLIGVTVMPSAASAGVMWKADPDLFGCARWVPVCRVDPLVEMVTSLHSSPSEVCALFTEHDGRAPTTQFLGDYVATCIRPGFPDIYVYAVCSEYPANFLILLSDRTCPSDQPQPTRDLVIVDDNPVIPADFEMERGKVLTRSTLNISLLNRGQGVSGTVIPLQSDRGTTDKIVGPGSTNSAGQASATIETRDQSTQSRATPTTPGIFTSIIPAQISWLPADYESSFLVTCYGVALETDHMDEPSQTNVCGLPPENSYKTGFIKDTKVQGTGLTASGKYIHYNTGTGCFNSETCPRTATGVCAIDGTTIAVDPNIIPRRSTVNVAILGERKAQDGGGWIDGYHIDDFMGTRYSECLGLGRRHSTIRFINY